MVGESVTNKRNIWGKNSPICYQLNADAYDKVLKTVEALRNNNYSQNCIATITIMGEAGTGKTKLMSRLRHHLSQDSSALFVHVNASEYSNLDCVKYQFLKTLALEFKRVHSQEVHQWQEVAIKFAQEGFPNLKKKPPKKIVEEFEQHYQKQKNSRQNNQDLIQKISDSICKREPEVNPYVIRAIVWTLSQSYNVYAVEWLAGNQLDIETAKKMGLPNHNDTNESEKDAEAIDKIKQILKLATAYKPVVICFDELDGNICSSNGVTLPQIIGGFVKNLYDSLEHLQDSKGLVILTSMLPSIWVNHFQKVSGDSFFNTVRDRISTVTQGKPIELGY